jgi:hypothetical protein
MVHSNYHNLVDAILFDLSRYYCLVNHFHYYFVLAVFMRMCKVRSPQPFSVEIFVWCEEMSIQATFSSEHFCIMLQHQLFWMLTLLQNPPDYHQAHITQITPKSGLPQNYFIITHILSFAHLPYVCIFVFSLASM